MVDLSKAPAVSLRKPARAPLRSRYAAALATRYPRDCSRSEGAKVRDTGRAAARKGKAHLYRVGF